MTNAELIAKIKVEVERRKTIQLKRIQEGDMVDSAPYDKNEAYNELLSFLSTLESEKPINPVLQDFPTTEKEMQDFLATHERIPVPERLNSLERILQEQPVCEGLEEELKDYFRHYYNCDYPKQIEDKTCSVMMIHLVECARHFAQWGAEHATHAETPADLEEAANNYLDGVYGKIPHSDFHIAIFIAGAKWHREQMMKDWKELWSQIVSKYNPLKED